ncbi:flagellar hook-associated protein FlgL [uncultured Microbacterium sp.]|uniref:flagellar hook-associated protein FlgL n=1 Tax=uncultured Microbacterium sp. TaxID=191216 RepID=UPI0025E47029|nr:flagellar hook-associated protein FlgL [uncultured Microbacterium sp.]
MIGRISSSTLTQQTLRTLQSHLQDRDRLQNQATSQRAFRVPSEDPAAAATTLGVHGEQSRVAQYARNIGDGIAWVTSADSALASSVGMLNRARDLIVQGANSGALNDAARASIAAELDGISKELLSQANTTMAGRNIFAGTSDEGEAFDPTTFAFRGVPGDGVQRRVDDDTSVRVDVDGAQVYGEGAGSVFALLGDIAAQLRSGAAVGPRLDDIDARLKTMVSAQGAVGARQAQLERASSQNLASSTDLEARRASVENVDSVEVLVKLQSAELVYQSALQVTAKSLQSNLLEFLR